MKPVGSSVLPGETAKSLCSVCPYLKRKTTSGWPSCSPLRQCHSRSRCPPYLCDSDGGSSAWGAQTAEQPGGWPSPAFSQRPHTTHSGTAPGCFEVERRSRCTRLVVFNTLWALLKTTLNRNKVQSCKCAVRAREILKLLFNYREKSKLCRLTKQFDNKMEQSSFQTHTLGSNCDTMRSALFPILPVSVLIEEKAGQYPG